MNFRNSFNNWREYRKTVGELHALSNRELSDLGISRHDIQRVAKAARK